MSKLSTKEKTINYHYHENKTQRSKFIFQRINVKRVQT